MKNDEFESGVEAGETEEIKDIWQQSIFFLFVLFLYPNFLLKFYLLNCGMKFIYEFFSISLPFFISFLRHHPEVN